ncbi:MAG TPA: 2-amino-4-hydroxy-6-hydroxymethyldihydropteridine diphosphokinase [Propionibacteriaceae bacterium]|nr:2-amino-4-hydroxy-6-hydroxymethyldihydropteridine diphosphokinase [Propionibacteriaceae bacterium]
MKVAFGLGSNLGDREGHLQAAVAGLARRGVRDLRVSSAYETDPVGGPAQPDYLNAVAVGETSLAAVERLTLAKELEFEAQRVRTVRNAPRTLDVDILALGDVVLHTEQLTLPHPRAHERAFVLVPWAEIDPDFPVPGLGKVAELAASVDASGVRPGPVVDLRGTHA